MLNLISDSGLPCWVGLGIRWLCWGLGLSGFKGQRVDSGSGRRAEGACWLLWLSKELKGVSPESRRPIFMFLRRLRRRKLPFSNKSSMDSQPVAKVQKFPFPFSLPSVRGTCGK